MLADINSSFGDMSFGGFFYRPVSVVLQNVVTLL